VNRSKILCLLDRTKDSRIEPMDFRVRVSLGARTHTIHPILGEESSKTPLLLAVCSLTLTKNLARALAFRQYKHGASGSFRKECPHYYFFFLAFLGVPHLPQVIHFTYQMFDSELELMNFCVCAQRGTCFIYFLVSRTSLLGPQIATTAITVAMKRIRTKRPPCCVARAGNI